MIEVKFSLELTKNGVQKCVHAKSGEENSRKAVITLTENGKVFDAAGYYVKVYFDNGKHVDTEDDRKLVTVENGCIGFVIPYDLVAEEGERLCELQISKDNRILYSPVFKVLVEQSLGQHGVSEPVGDVTRYQEVIPDLMPKDDILFDDEIAVYTPEDELTTKRRVSSLPFGKRLENEAQIERIDASDVDEIKQLSNGKYAEAKDVPTKVSQLTNDKNFVDAQVVESMIDGALDNVGGLTDEQKSALDANTKARHTHSNKTTVLDKFSLDNKENLLFDGKPVISEGGNVEATTNPRATMAQTVALLLEGSMTNISIEAPNVASTDTSNFASLMFNLASGNTLIYAPPKDGKLTYLNMVTYESETITVNAGGIYEFYIDMDVYEMKVNSYFGEGVLAYFKSKLLEN